MENDDDLDQIYIQYHLVHCRLSPTLQMRCTAIRQR